MVSIVDRGKGEKVAALCRDHHLYYHVLCLGMGTASSEMLDYLGLGRTEKDVTLTLGPKDKLPAAMTDIAKALQLHKPGRGIVFTIPLSGISSLFSKILLREEAEPMDQEKVSQESCQKHDMIIAVINRGWVDELMTAARSVGARGGTVLDGRGLGYQDAEKLLGVSISAEKSIVCILCKKSDKHRIMEAINAQTGIKSEARGLLFSLPVDDICGLNIPRQNQPPQGK
jgi:nitrogen regulatory protein PII